MKLTNVTLELWDQAASYIESLVERTYQNCNAPIQIHIAYGDGVKFAPCTTQQWRTQVGIEHDLTRCTFTHWFERNLQGKIIPCKFSQKAALPLIRSCVWSTLIAEHLQGKVSMRDAVKNRVIREIADYSNCPSTEISIRIADLAQRFYELIKWHLNKTSSPLNRAGLAAAESMVVKPPFEGMDFSDKRKGWCNSRKRNDIVEAIVSSGIENLKTRSEQEARIRSFVSSHDELKESAFKAIRSKLLHMSDSDGVCILKPWSKEEISEIRRSASMQCKSKRGGRNSGTDRQHEEAIQRHSNQRQIYKEAIDINLPLIAIKEKKHPSNIFPNDNDIGFADDCHNERSENDSVLEPGPNFGTT